MYVDFETLPDHARLWIYQADRKFTLEEEKIIIKQARAFCDQWMAHGNPLKTSYKIEYHQFLMFLVDEGFNGASGCSIDGSVRMLKSFKDEMGIDFLDHSKVAFLIDSEVKLIPVKGLKEAFDSGTLGPLTLSFNSQVINKGTWKNERLLRVDKTWLSRYLPKSSVA